MSSVSFTDVKESKNHWTFYGKFRQDWKSESHHFCTTIRTARINEAKEPDEANVYIFGPQHVLFKISTQLYIPNHMEEESTATNYLNFDYTKHNLPTTLYIGMIGSIISPVFVSVP